MQDQNLQIKSATANTNEQQPNYKRRFFILLLLLLLFGFIIILTVLIKNKIDNEVPDDESQSSSEEPKGTNTNPAAVYPTFYIQTITQTSSNDIAISFNSPNQVKVNQNFTVNLLLDSRSKQVTGLELYIEYPKDMYEIVSFKASESMPIVLKGPILKPGSIDVDLGTSPSQQQTGQFQIAQVILKARKPGQGGLTISEKTKGAALTYRDYIKVIAEPLTITNY